MHLNRIALSAVALLIGTVLNPTARVHAAQGPPPPGSGWDAPAQELNDIQRHGFHEGIQAAHQDFDVHRRPDANVHEIYRHPQVPPEQREAFRDGFRRGYDQAIRHLFGDEYGLGAFQSPQTPPPSQWEAPPTEFNETRRLGFHDGIEAARGDYEYGRPPDTTKHKEFLHPSVPPELWNDYREGFHRGYSTAFRNLIRGS